jgi:hypothetical protein
VTTTITGRTATVTSTGCVRQRRQSRALTVVAAAAATFGVWAVAHPLAGADLVVDTGSGPTTVTPAAVVVVTVIAGLTAWALLALVERFSRRAAAIWSWIAGAVLLMSLLGPIGSALTTGTATTLVAMHLAAGAVLIPLMARSSVRCRGAGRRDHLRRS